MGYDALGRRIEKVVNGVSTQYIYDNEDIIAELDGSAAVKALYIHGPGIDEPLAMFRAGQLFTFHADGLGSITTLTDAFGAPVRSYTYDSFGRVVAQTGTVSNPYTYTSREFDPETGLYHYRARSYDPGLGRFLQEDPIGFMGGPNFYGYVRGNPQRLIDPLGLQPIVGFHDVIRVRPGSVGFGTTLGFLDGNWNTDNPSSITYNALLFPELGGGFNFCRDLRPVLDEKEDAVNSRLIAPESTCTSFAAERSRNMPAERPLPVGPFTFQIGFRYLGISFADDFSRFCVNAGLSVGIRAFRGGPPRAPIRRLNVAGELLQAPIVPAVNLGG